MSPIGQVEQRLWGLGRRREQGRRAAAQSTPARPATREEIEAALPDASKFFVEPCVKWGYTMAEVLAEWAESERVILSPSEEIANLDAKHAALGKALEVEGKRLASSAGLFAGHKPQTMGEVSKGETMATSVQRVLTDEERFRQDWDNEPTMQAHFGGRYNTYVHYRRALRDGRVNVVEHSPGVFHGKPVPSIG